MSEVIATAEFQGATLGEIHAKAGEAFRAFLGENIYPSVVVVDTATVAHHQTTVGGDTVFRAWKATCHLVSKETAT
jgi:hypothetical protein